MPLPQLILTGVFLVCALICFVYGVAVYMVHSGTSFFVVWLAMGAGFLGLAAMSAFRLFQRIPVPLRVGAGIILALGLCAFAYTQIRILRCFGHQAPKNLDYVIVLGAQINSYGPSLVLRFRLNAAIDYLNENPGTICIVSGGKGTNEDITEAEGMRDYLVRHHIAAERILLENESHNTIQNILNSKKMLAGADSSVGLITNDFHVYRATALARKQGYKAIYGIPAPSDPWYLPNNMLREFIGIAKDSVLGHMSPFS